MTDARGFAYFPNGLSGFDTINNVEKVIVDSPGPGRIYHLYVKGTAIPASDAQNYSLVVNGPFTYGGQAPPPPAVALQLGTALECFSARDRVSLRDGIFKSMAEVKVGDEIQTLNDQGHLEYSPVIYLPHGRNNIPAAFVEILLEDGKKIRMTPDHLVPLLDCRLRASNHLDHVSSSHLSQTLVPARHVNTTDCLLVASHDTSHSFSVKMVVDVTEQVIDDGVYTAVTMNPFLVSLDQSQIFDIWVQWSVDILSFPALQALSWCSTIGIFL